VVRISLTIASSSPLARAVIASRLSLMIFSSAVMPVATLSCAAWLPMLITE
jgi:hypothetical protein